MHSPRQPPVRLTTWPLQPLPLPPLVVFPLRLTKDGFFERDLTKRAPGSSRGRLVTLPDELYLRELREIDLDDVHAVESFVAAYGPLGRPHWGELPNAYLPGQPEVLAVIDAEFARYQSERGLAQRPAGLSHVEEFRIHARLLRDLVRILAAEQGLLALTSVEAQWESRWVTPQLWRSGGLREAVAFLAECLAPPLRDYHVRLELSDGDGHELLARSESLYAVLCLQMWNHIADETPYRICQRPDCGRLFVRQQGRAKNDQHKKTGSLYCTARCARVMASRKFRDGQRKTSA